METLKKIVSNQYFPAAAVLTAVLLFWAVGLLGGLSLLHNNQPPLTTLTWMLFVYTAAVLTPLAGIVAAADLLRRWRRNRDARMAYAGHPEDEYSVARQVPEHAAEAGPAEAQTVAQQVVPEHAGEEPAVRHAAPPAPAASQPKKSAKQAGRKQAA